MGHNTTFFSITYYYQVKDHVLPNSFTLPTRLRSAARHPFTRVNRWRARALFLERGSSQSDELCEHFHAEAELVNIMAIFSISALVLIRARTHTRVPPPSSPPARSRHHYVCFLLPFTFIRTYLPELVTLSSSWH